MLERIFHLTENQTTVRRELLGGLTTFMAMAYVVVVNPRILGEAGMPVEGVLFATCVSAALATLVMGLWANYPIALAPGMSLNAYFTYSIVLGRGVPWQTALGVVFLSGTLFLILTLTNIREHIVNDIPDCLKHGTAAGIGFFIAFVGLRNAKIIVANSATFVGLGKSSDSEVRLAAFGLVLIAILMSRRIGGAILIGIVVIAIAGIPLGLTTVPSHVFSWPHPGGTFLKLDFRSALKIGLGDLVFVFFFVDLFDNVGTLVGVCEQGGFLRNGKFPRASRALLADAFGTMAGALTGTSTVTSYIESAAGVAAGARTGLGNVLIAGTFCRSDFLRPARRRRSDLCNRSGPDSCGRAHVRVTRQSALGRFYGSVPRIYHDCGDAAHLQYRHRIEPGAALVHFHQDWHRKDSADQSPHLGPLRALLAAFRVPRS